MEKDGSQDRHFKPFTIAQNSLYGFFGASGDLAMVPPKAANIGPNEVINAKYRMDMHALNTAGTNVSWQRFITRLCLHGEVTSLVPQSILQTLKTDIFVSATIAKDIEPDWDTGYKLINDELSYF
jgi:glucosamine-6-phosphate deaminase